MEFGLINIFGGIIVILILIPNIIYALKNHNNNEKSIPTILSVCEQIGRYGCMILMCVPLLVWKFKFESKEKLLIYFLTNGFLILVYYLGWILYFKNPSLKTGMLLAIIPTVVFLDSGLLLRHWLLVAVALLFGLSHGRITYITHSEK